MKIVIAGLIAAATFLGALLMLAEVLHIEATSREGLLRHNGTHVGDRP